jgi:MFS family permease
MPLLFVILNRQYHIPLTHITLIVTVNFVFQLATDFASIFFVEKIGYRTTGIIAYSLVAVGFAWLGLIAPYTQNPYPWILLSVVLYSIGGGLLEVLISPVIESCPSKNKSASMSMLHSMFGFGSAATILVTTIALKIFGWQSWGKVALFWGLLSLLNGCYFAFAPLNKMISETERTAISSLVKDKNFWGFVLIMGCGGASEVGMSQWASAFAESSLGVSKATGDILGPCAFALMLALERVLYAKIAHRLDLSKCIIACAIATLLCYFTTALVSISWIALVSCAFCGFVTAIMWPGTLSLASKKYPLGGATLFALLALGGDIGCTLGPSFVGFISSGFGGKLEVGLLFGSIFPIILISSLLSLRKKL